MKAHTDVKMAHMQYELMFQNDVGCDMCVLVAMFDIAMFPSDREGDLFTPKQNPVKAPCSRKKYYVNFFLLHICMYKVREPKVRHWESVRMRSISNEHHPRTMLILASGSDFLDFPRFGCMTESDHLRMKLFEKVLIWASASRFRDFPRPLEGVRNKSFSNENPFTQCLSWITAAELQDPRSGLQGKCSHCNNLCYAAE